MEATHSIPRQYLSRLHEVDFIEEVRLVGEPRTKRNGQQADGKLKVRTKSGERAFFIAVKRTHLSYALADQAVDALGDAKARWILMAPSIGRPLGHYLAERGINYIDLAGNCNLRLSRGYIARIEGRRAATREPQGRGTSAPGYQVLFALLAKCELLVEPLRCVAKHAGVSRQTVSAALKRLVADGVMVGDPGKYLWVDGGKRQVLDRWLFGYADRVRPRLLAGSYQTTDATPTNLEQRLGRILGNNIQWRWGGGAAAYRLTGHYRGPQTVIHLDVMPEDLLVRLGAIADPNGSLTVLGIPGTVALNGATPDTVHPLLAYSELMCIGSERAREAAIELLGVLDLE